MIILIGKRGLQSLSISTDFLLSLHSAYHFPFLLSPLLFTYLSYHVSGLISLNLDLQFHSFLPDYPLKFLLPLLIPFLSHPSHTLFIPPSLPPTLYPYVRLPLSSLLWSLDSFSTFVNVML